MIGTKDAVPALKALLADPKFAHYARFGLEPIPDPSADEALRSERNQREPRNRKAPERLADFKAPGIDTDGKLPVLDGDQAELLEAANFVILPPGRRRRN